MQLSQRIYWIFFLQPLALGAWFPRIPEIQTTLGLDNGELAIAIAGAPVGTLITLLFAGKLVAKIGARRVILLLYPVYFLAMVLPYIAPGLLSLMLALACVGSTLTTLELGFNVLADEYEKRTDHKIMSKAHGLWSFGLLGGTLIGSITAWLDISAILMGSCILIAALPVAMLVSLNLPEDRKPQIPDFKTRSFAPPHPILLGVSFFTFGATLTEGAVADWSAVFLRDIYQIGPGIAGVGVILFSLSVALTRLAGDRLRLWTSPGKLARKLSVFGMFGVVLVYFAPGIISAVIGFSIIGIGAALAFPLAVSAAASAPGRTPASNVAVLSFIALAGFLVGPLVIGAVADVYDIRLGLLVLAPMLAISFVLAPNLDKALQPD
ncbi:MAG: MFS transporter [Cohaesibacteraceae bacterium]|nr:MFS transporter [Cohaesibacteraceae bacterium]